MVRWSDLSATWQKVVSELYPETDLSELGATELIDMLTTPTLRLVGPKGMNPSLSFELKTLEGIEVFSEIEHLFIMSMAITDITPIKKLTKLKSLFISDNRIESLTGIENCTQLSQLYCQGNKISSIEEIADLLHLEKLNCSSNEGLTSFEGLMPAHADNDIEFVGLPNRGISPAEIQRVEYELGIPVNRY